jgi:hypothetical protein
VIVPVAVDERAVLPHRQADLHPERLGVPVDDLPVQIVHDGPGWSRWRGSIPSTATRREPFAKWK